MKFLKLSAIALLSVGFFACGGGSDEETEKLLSDLEKSLDEMDAEESSSSSSSWSTETDGEYFEIDIPGRMDVKYDLNQEAALQYGYVEEQGLEVLEHYVIVVERNKEKEKEINPEVDINSYRDFSVESLETGLDDYEVLTTDPKVVQVNGMNCVKNEMRGSLGAVNVYYQLGVFEGEKAFYQVLTWCIEEQKSRFKSDMEKMIDSFKEL